MKWNYLEKKRKKRSAKLIRSEEEMKLYSGLVE